MFVLSHSLSQVRHGNLKKKIKNALAVNRFLIKIKVNNPHLKNAHRIQ